MGFEWVSREIRAGGRIAQRSLLDDMLSAEEITQVVFEREVDRLKAEEAAEGDSKPFKVIEI